MSPSSWISTESVRAPGPAAPQPDDVAPHADVVEAWAAATSRHADLLAPSARPLPALGPGWIGLAIDLLDGLADILPLPLRRRFRLEALADRHGVLRAFWADPGAPSTALVVGERRGVAMMQPRHRGPVGVWVTPVLVEIEARSRRCCAVCGEAGATVEFPVGPAVRYRRHVGLDRDAVTIPWRRGITALRDREVALSAAARALASRYEGRLDGPAVLPREPGWLPLIGKLMGDVEQRVGKAAPFRWHGFATGQGHLVPRWTGPATKEAAVRSLVAEAAADSRGACLECGRSGRAVAWDDGRAVLCPRHQPAAMPIPVSAAMT